MPGIAEENYWFCRHEAAYRFLAPRCAGRSVLEAGCGEGYGADAFARTARRVVALDYDEPAVTHVARRYPGLHPVRGNLASLPIGSARVDVVANLQVIEHLWDQEGFLAECRRVLHPAGRLLVTTPNRLTFSPGRDTPLNPFHTRELSPAELLDLLRRAGFAVPVLVGLQHGSRLRGLDAAHGGSLVDAQLRVALTGESWPARLLSDVASVTADDFVVDDDRLDDSLDLIAVATPT